jgi:ribose transport system ATP-binding protein
MSILELRGMQKKYGGAHALAGVDFELRKSEVHALLGGNGAGKSTLIKILAGVERADSGTVTIDGKPLAARHRPQDVFLAGVRFVHQDLGVFDELSIAENIALETGYARRFGVIDFPSTERRVRGKLSQMDAGLDPKTRVGNLSQAEKVIVAITRALDADARIVVLDEVTASLPSPEAARLHSALRAARQRGMSFIFVTHRIEEIFGLCDRVTVLANGRRVATDAVEKIDRATVIRWIVGHDEDVYPTKSAAPGERQRVVLRDALGGPVQEPVTLKLHAGEVLGITGLIGSGYLQLASWLSGLAVPEAGSLTIDETLVRFGFREDFEVTGCQVVLGDRAAAAFADLTVRENLFPSRVLRASNILVPSLAYERHATNRLIDHHAVRPLGCAEMPLRTLSGGNQQKLLFLRALEHQPRLLVLIDPTAGVDVAGRKDLYDMLHAQTARGVGVILATSDFDEVIAESHRVMVLSGGRVRALLSGSELTPKRLIAEAHRSEDFRQELNQG